MKRLQEKFLVSFILIPPTLRWVLGLMVTYSKNGATSEVPAGINSLERLIHGTLDTKVIRFLLQFPL